MTRVAFACLVVSATYAGAQPPAAPLDPDVPAHLTAWETAMKQANSFSTQCTLVRKNAILRRETSFKGSINCLKPNMARMRLDKVPPLGANPDNNDYNDYICTGKEIYEYDGSAKQVTEYKLRNGGVGDNLLLAILSGSLTATDISKRFEVTSLKKDDPNYLFLEFKPREAKDKADFESMTVVLFRPNLAAAPGKGYLPRTVVIRKNNRQEEEVWDFPNLVLNDPRVVPGQFVFVPVPKELGWKFLPAPK